MIQRFNNTPKQISELLTILGVVKEGEFYLTENNQRIYVKDFTSLKKLLKTSNDVFWYIPEEEVKSGIILVWKSFGGNVTRNYIKFLANNEDTLRNLLTVLLWNTTRELYIKIKKDSTFVKVFKSKGFRFIGGRGSQVLLVRPKFRKPKEEIMEKEHGLIH